MKKHLYLLIPFVLIGGFLGAQSPGGVNTNLNLWIRSNSGITTAGSAVTTWTYTNDPTKSFTAAGGLRPTLTTNGINLQPVITFVGGQAMDGPNGVNAPIAVGDDDYSVFGVWRSTVIGNFPSPERVWSQRGFGAGADGVSLWLYNTTSNPAPQAPNYGNQPEIAPFTQGAPRAYTIGTWYISQLNLLNQGANDQEIVDQLNLATAPQLASTDGANGAATRNLANNSNVLGARITGPGTYDEFLTGDIAEIIVFDRPVSGAERSRIFSYLALKYGITTGASIVASNGTTTPWDATANSLYNNAVFGLGRDNTSGLLVTNSNSIETGSGDGTGQSGRANIRLFNPSSLATDLNFLVIGHDNGALTETGSDLPPAAAGSLRLGREWKVQHTGNVGTVDAEFTLTGLTVSGTAAGQFRLAVDEDGDGNFATGTVRYYTPSSYTGGVLAFAALTLNNNEVFTLITVGTAVFLPVTWKEVTARSADEAIYISWSVENNEDALSYEIEHSLNGTNFTQAGIVANNKSIKKYEFAYTALITGKHFFRIRQVDKDGTFSYSRIVSASPKRSADFAVQLLNNPVRGNFVELDVTAIRSAKADVEIWTAQGVRISSKAHSISAGLNRIRVALDAAPKGNYILKFNAGSASITKKIVKL